MTKRNYARAEKPKRNRKSAVVKKPAPKSREKKAGLAAATKPKSTPVTVEVKLASLKKKKISTPVKKNANAQSKKEKSPAPDESSSAASIVVVAPEEPRRSARKAASSQWSTMNGSSAKKHAPLENGQGHFTEKQQAKGPNTRKKSALVNGTNDRSPNEGDILIASEQRPMTDADKSELPKTHKKPTQCRGKKSKVQKRLRTPEEMEPSPTPTEYRVSPVTRHLASLVSVDVEPENTGHPTPSKDKVSATRKKTAKSTPPKNPINPADMEKDIRESSGSATEASRATTAPPKTPEKQAPTKVDMAATESAGSVIAECTEEHLLCSSCPESAPSDDNGSKKKKSQTGGESQKKLTLEAGTSQKRQLAAGGRSLTKKRKKETVHPQNKSGHVPGTDQWEVETLLDYRVAPGQTTGDVEGARKMVYFAVKWVGYDEDSITLEPVTHLLDSLALVKAFLRKRGKTLVIDPEEEEATIVDIQ